MIRHSLVVLHLPLLGLLCVQHLQHAHVHNHPFRLHQSQMVRGPWAQQTDMTAVILQLLRLFLQCQLQSLWLAILLHCLL